MKITENCGKHFQLNMQIVLMMLQKCQLPKILSWYTTSRTERDSEALEAALN